MSKKLFLKETMILTCAGLLARLIGFFYRIFLSHAIGAQGMGIYQLVFPLQTLVMAITSSGIQIAISRFVASHMAIGQDKKARDYFTFGTILALFLCVILSAFIYLRADFFANEILKEPLTFPLIRLISFSFPLGTLHSCISSFYFARKKTVLPSFVQLLEQISRVAASCLIYLILLSEGKEATPLIAAAGSLISEFVASFVSLFAIWMNFHKNHYTPAKPAYGFRLTRNILCISLPHSLNRILVTLLGSIEVVLIPQRLQMYGLSASEALSIYGIFTGMAMPFILFPSTITNSVSVMLMPSVAEFQALGYKKRIGYVIGRTCKYCILLGSFCTFLFFFFGKFMGTILFKSPTAGTYIQTLSFICPFLYLNTVLTSILNGLGKAGRCLIHNVVSIIIRIAFVLFAIPQTGIRGYFYGILFGEIIHSILHLLALFQFKPTE